MLTSLNPAIGTTFKLKTMPMLIPNDLGGLRNGLFAMIHPAALGLRPLGGEQLSYKIHAKWSIEGAPAVTIYNLFLQAGQPPMGGQWSLPFEPTIQPTMRWMPDQGGSVVIHNPGDEGSFVIHVSIPTYLFFDIGPATDGPKQATLTLSTHIRRECYDSIERYSLIMSAFSSRHVWRWSCWIGRDMRHSVNLL
jgi:hypothetical protein